MDKPQGRVWVMAVEVVVKFGTERGDDTAAVT
jgi:hypothetical protein